MSSVIVNLNIDEQLKDDAEKLFSDLGMNFDDIVTALLKRAVESRTIAIGGCGEDLQIAKDEQLDALSERLIEQNAEAYGELAK